MYPANRGQQNTAVEMLGSVTGVAVVVAGFLYIIGILVTSAELWHAGVSVRDTLPLLSLEQLLARGVSLVLPTLVLLGAAAAGVGIYWVAEKRFQDDIAMRLADIASHLPEAAREQWLADATKANDQTHWPNLSLLLKQPQQLVDGKAKKSIIWLRLRAWFANLPSNLLGLGLWAIIPFVSPVLSVAALLTSIALTVLGARPLWYFFGVGYAILVLALLVNPWVDPRPLPTATISTDKTGVVSGKFLFIKDGRWFVTVKSDGLRVVEPDDVKSARIARGDARRTLLEVLSDGR